MNPVPLFLIIVTLPLLLGGCGEKVEVEPVALPNPTEGAPVKPNLKYEIKGDAVTITGCNEGASGKLVIPATFEGKTVTSIGEDAFWGCSRLTSITIPDGVTSIGYGAFRSCGLSSITIPDSVTSIGGTAFKRCSRLTSITIPDSVTSIGGWAFKFCLRLTSVTIPNSVTRIGNGTFDYCESLTSITIPDSVISIGESAFSYCKSLTSITIGDSVTSIDGFAFRDCSSLTAVTFLGDAPKNEEVFFATAPTIYRKPEAKGWGETFAGRPVNLISEKP